MKTKGLREFSVARRGGSVKRHPAALALTALVVLASAAQGKDFWKKKPVEEWTQEETITVLTHSPWAQEVVVHRFTGRLLEEKEKAERYYISGRGIPTIPATSERVHRRPEFVESRYRVSWSSAAIVQRAGQRLRQVAPQAVLELHAPPPGLPAGQHVLTVRMVQPSSGPVDHLLRRERSAELLEAVELRTNRKLTLKPAHVLRQGLGAGANVSFFFPRQLEAQPTLPAGTEWVEFILKSRQGDTLKVKFKPKEMRWAGQPDY